MQVSSSISILGAAHFTLPHALIYLQSEQLCQSEPSITSHLLSQLSYLKCFRNIRCTTVETTIIKLSHFHVADLYLFASSENFKSLRRYPVTPLFSGLENICHPHGPIHFSGRYTRSTESMSFYSTFNLRISS